MNIMDMVKGAVSDQIMGQIGGMLGIPDQKKTSSIFDTAIGSILGGMMQKSSSQEGAKQVFDMASNADVGIMDKLGDILGGGGDDLDAMQKSGGGMLEGLLGGGQSGMIQTIAKAVGLDGSIVGKLLTLAAPMLLGMIGKHIKSAGLDALGLSSLLGEQKQHLSAAMPSGLTESLGFGNLLAGVGDVGKSGLNAASNVASSATNAVGNASQAAAGAANDAAKKGGGLLAMLLPLIIIGAIGYLAYPYIMGAADRAKEGAQGVVNKAGDLANGMTGSLDFGDLDLSPLGETGTKLQEGFSGITSGFTGLADTGEEGANALATKITDFSGSFDSLGLGNMSEAAKPVATTMIGKFIETVQGLLDKQNVVIKGILQGPVDTLLEKLKSFS